MKIRLRGCLLVVLAVGMAACGEKDPAAGDGDGTGSQRGDGGAEATRHVLASPGHRLPNGSTVTSTHSFEWTDTVMTLERDGRKLLGTMTAKTAREVRATVVSETETRVVIASDAQSIVHSVAGVEQVRPAEANPLEGIPVVFTRTDGKWVGALESGTPATEAQEEKIAWLAEQLEDDDAVEMFGTEPREVGEEWEVDPDKASFVGDGASFDGTYRLRLDRVEEFDGEACAVLIGSINVSGKLESGRGGSGDVSIVVPHAVIYRSLESFENLKAVFEGQLYKAEYPQPGESAVVRGKMRISQRATVEIP